MRKLLCRRYHTWISRTCLSLYESNGRDRCWLVVNEGFISGPRRSQSFVNISTQLTPPAARHKPTLDLTQQTEVKHQVVGQRLTPARYADAE